MGLHPDGGGLYLQVTKSKDGKTINKSWVFRFTRDGKERRMGLGSLNTFGLGEAREKAAECRKQLDAGHDPIEQRDAERASRLGATSKSKTFEQCAVAYIAASISQPGDFDRPMASLVPGRPAALPSGLDIDAKHRDRSPPLWALCRCDGGAVGQAAARARRPEPHR